jgi:hypothetical protein
MPSELFQSNSAKIFSLHGLQTYTSFTIRLFLDIGLFAKNVEEDQTMIIQFKDKKVKIQLPLKASEYYKKSKTT